MPGLANWWPVLKRSPVPGQARFEAAERARQAALLIEEVDLCGKSLPHTYTTGRPGSYMSGAEQTPKMQVRWT